MERNAGRVKISLRQACPADAEIIWRMQKAAFAALLEKYQDGETNPGAEPLERVSSRLAQKQTYFYFIMADGRVVGAIRVVDFHDPARRKRISPLFILPEHRNRGYAQQAIAEAERLHGAHGWTLDTILQEDGNCHLYEKMGYQRTGEERKVNDRLTLVVYTKD